jgi:error-prone DNA polymerase
MIEPDDSIRLGLRVVRRLHHEHAAHLVEQRGDRPFLSMEDFKRRVSLNKDEFRTLAEIGALNCFAEHRRSARWHGEKTQRPEELFSDSITVTLANGPAVGHINSPLAPMTPIERVQADYTGMNLSTGPHPMALVRSQLKNVWRAADLRKAQNGQIVRIAGHVICRQRPGRTS